ncbi:hypothetical protein [Maribellus mangrovi]
MQIVLRGSWCVIRWILVTSFNSAGQERNPIPITTRSQQQHVPTVSMI